MFLVASTENGFPKPCCPGNQALRLVFILQAMWEDNNTRAKWVTVHRCYFPGDLPEAVGRPCGLESSEVNYVYPFLKCFASSAMMYEQKI